MKSFLTLRKGGKKQSPPFSKGFFLVQFLAASHQGGILSLGWGLNTNRHTMEKGDQETGMEHGTGTVGITVSILA